MYIHFSFTHNQIQELSWEKVNKRFPKYSNILQVIDLLLCLPASSTEIERGFSHMKKILGEDGLCDQLILQLESEDIERYFSYLFLT